MTAFEIVLKRPTIVPEAVPAEPSDLDFDSIVMELCTVLASSDCFFRIGGFGQSDWPVDIRYDLSTLIEQLPETLGAVRSRLPATIDLYGQGIERTLRFDFGGNFVNVSCDSRTRWKPEVNIQGMTYSGLLSMLESVAKEFAESLRLVWPRLATLPPFLGWL